MKGERIEQRRNIREPRKRPSRQIHQDRESRCHIYRRLQSPLCFAEWGAKGTDCMDQCRCVGAIAERVANFCRKGTFVYIHGSLNTRSYDDDSGQRHWIMEVVADIVADPKWGEGKASSGGSYSGGYSNGSGGASNGYGNNSSGFNQFGPSKPEQREESMFPAKGPQEDIPF